MNRILPRLLVGLAPFAFAEDPPKPAAPPTTTEAAPSAEEKAARIEKIRADNRARYEKEKAGNVRDMVVVREEKVDLAKLIGGKLTDAEGRPVTPESILKAKYVAFYHSASWCCGCKVFTPKLVEAAKKYAPGEIAVILVSWDKPGAPTQDYLKKSGLSVSIPRSALKDGPARLAIHCIPHLRVYDAAGALAMDTLDETGGHRSYEAQLGDLDKLAAKAKASK